MKQSEQVHIGRAIKARFDEFDMSKTEFGTRIGVRQQHVNRLFESESIDTKRLAMVCQVLDFNFFSLYTGNAADIAPNNQVEVQRQRISDMEEIKDCLKAQIQLLKDSVEQLKSQLRDKDEIIKMHRGC